MYNHGRFHAYHPGTNPGFSYGSSGAYGGYGYGNYGSNQSYRRVYGGYNGELLTSTNVIKPASKAMGNSQSHPNYQYPVYSRTQNNRNPRHRHTYQGDRLSARNIGYVPEAHFNYDAGDWTGWGADRWRAKREQRGDRWRREGW
ncbi:hypothetical protein P153DRAFT_380781 [Dothidotthia symphoricarpi CBS 119687]|uniref:Uncharacterized protein n=1 Tax=Dothidotthia symphoricarpi CBS 119687 TaxID=1392245 RepID=A0A6A6AVJ2_9PLEO|nr:uncharacterized protein P153DRAFT_380781 [Dothidotthia symphoricarpi CBS 119687]KAF2134975.1 hypothetical protein P153DRAFT_380781 [Dothidotthia symphoricarpi CBS 119687]